MEPGPIPTLMASAPASTSALAASSVAMFPTTTSTCGNAALTALRAVITPLEWPWALSRTMASAPAFTRSSTRWRASLVMPEAAATLRPRALTLATSVACFSGLMFLWMTPIPPASAMAIAMGASVTVSMAAEMKGTSSVMFRVKCVLRSTSFGSTSEYEGTRRTSSKVIPSWIILVLSEDIALRFVMHAKIHNFSEYSTPSSPAHPQNRPFSRTTPLVTACSSLNSAIFKDGTPSNSTLVLKFGHFQGRLAEHFFQMDAAGGFLVAVFDDDGAV